MENLLIKTKVFEVDKPVISANQIETKPDKTVISASLKKTKLDKSGTSASQIKVELTEECVWCGSW